MPEWTWLLLYLLKLMDPAKHAELRRAPPASLMTTLGILTLASERIVEFAVEPPNDLVCWRRVWCPQPVGKSIKFVIIPEYLQPGGVILTARKPIRPIYNLLNRRVVQTLAQILPLHNQRNLILALLFALPIEENTLAVERPLRVSGQIEPLFRKRAGLRLMKYFPERHIVSELGIIQRVVC